MCCDRCFAVDIVYCQASKRWGNFRIGVVGSRFLQPLSTPYAPTLDMGLIQNPCPLAAPYLVTWTSYGGVVQKLLLAANSHRLVPPGVKYSAFPTQIARRIHEISEF
jgi:hypothetical protein